MAKRAWPISPSACRHACAPASSRPGRALEREGRAPSHKFSACRRAKSVDSSREPDDPAPLGQTHDRTLICLARTARRTGISNALSGQLDIASITRPLAGAALAANSGVHFDHVYSSDLRRAVATAAPHAEARALRSTNGPICAKSTTACGTASPMRTSRRAIRRNTSIISPAGRLRRARRESLMRFAARVRAALTKIAQAHPARRCSSSPMPACWTSPGAWRPASASTKRANFPRSTPRRTGSPMRTARGRWSTGRAKRAAKESRRPMKSGLAAPRGIARAVGQSARRNPAAALCEPHSANVAEQALPISGPAGRALEAGESFEPAPPRDFRGDRLKDFDLGEPIATREFPRCLPLVGPRGRALLSRPLREFRAKLGALTPEEKTYVEAGNGGAGGNRRVEGADLPERWAYAGGVDVR